MDAPVVAHMSPSHGWPGRRRQPTAATRFATLEAAEAALPSALVAAHDMPTEQAQDALERLIAWFNADPVATVSGRLVETAGPDVETLYFDLDHGRQWRAFATRDGRLSPVLGNTWLLTPAPVPSDL